MAAEAVMQQQTLAGNEDTPEEEPKGSSTNRSSSPDHDAGNITRLDCDDAVKPWVNERDNTGENFGLSTIYLDVKYELGEKKLQIGRFSRTERSNEDKGIGNLNSSVKSHGINLGSWPMVRQLQWRVDMLSKPESVRGIKAENIRVFVPEGADDHLTLHEGWDVDSVDEAAAFINNIEDPPGTEQFKKLAARYTTARNRSDHQGPIQSKIRAVEDTIRARLDFSTRFGSGTPEPHEEFDHLDLVELHEELEAARDELAETEDRATRLQEEISKLREERRNRMLPEWAQEQE
jgi:hypothetical protein